MKYLKENLEELILDIEESAKKVGKTKEDIKLVGVTKTIDLDVIEEAIRLGLTDIGENRVQELTDKMDNINEDVNFHMIGHLQSNKVKDIIGRVELIHSLDRKSLAKEINKRAKQNDISADALIEVNISGEESKFGLNPKDVKKFIEDIEKYGNINIRGLMTIAPHTNDEKIIRETFSGLRKLSEDIEKSNYKNVSMDYLSMGMTNDYKIAIEEGANIIRVGRKIFGDREY
ncbi:MAG TPA: YggS family pyridoxal phosphate-dependent enzyme [Tissierellaceae bacterium]